MQAYNNFKLLLQKLEDPATRAPTRAFLDEVDKHVQKEESGIDCLAKYHFRLHELALCYEGRQAFCPLFLYVVKILVVDWVGVVP